MRWDPGDEKWEILLRCEIWLRRDDVLYWPDWTCHARHTHLSLPSLHRVELGVNYTAARPAGSTMMQPIARALRYEPWYGDSKGITQFYLPPTYQPYIPAFTPQPQTITAHWLVLIAPIHWAMARLSWPGWLVIYRFSRIGSWTPDTVTLTHPSTNRAQCRVTSLIKTNALSLSYKLHANSETRVWKYICMSDVWVTGMMHQILNL